METLIRPMKIGDYEPVFRLWKRCFRRIYPQDRKEEYLSRLLP